MRKHRDRFENLVRTIIEDEPNAQQKTDLLEFVQEAMSAFPRYVDQVFHSEVQIQMAGIRLQTDDWDTERFQDAVKGADDRRRFVHDIAIAKAAQLNRLCDKYKIERFAPETQDRQVIADFCAELTAEYFLSGTKRKPENFEQIMDALRSGAHVNREGAFTKETAYERN